MSCKKDVDPCFKLKLVNELSTKLKELIIVCQKNFYYATNFKSGLIIKMLSLGTILLVIKFS